MGHSVLRVVVAAGVFAVSGLAWTDLVDAATKEINVTGDAARCDKQWGPPCYTPANGTITPVNVGDTVTWKVLDGTHTVTPVDPKAFGGSEDLTGPDATFTVTFDRPGVFAFYCRHHGSVEDDGKTHHGMWGKIDVKGEATTTTASTTTTMAPAPADPPRDEPKPEPRPDPRPAPPPTQPPAPSPPAPPPPASGSEGSGETAAGTGRKYVGPPPTEPPPPAPPSRAAAAEPEAPEPPRPAEPKPPRANESRAEDEVIDPDAVVVPPDEFVLPPSPQFPTPEPLSPEAEAPEGAPQGDTVAILKSEPGGHRRKLILIGTVVGVGAFALGVGGWKWAHRPSKYWPA